MRADQMIAAVAESARIADRDHAAAAVRATLTVLGQRLGSEAGDLAAQLPTELAERVNASGPEVERFGLAEFYHRVAAIEHHGCTPEQARQHARAVTAALREAVGAEYLHMLDQLPADYADLTHTEPALH